MNGKQYDAILEALSRRKFLKAGSATDSHNFPQSLEDVLN